MVHHEKAGEEIVMQSPTFFFYKQLLGSRVLFKGVLVGYAVNLLIKPVTCRAFIYCSDLRGKKGGFGLFGGLIMEVIKASRPGSMEGQGFIPACNLRFSNMTIEASEPPRSGENGVYLLPPNVRVNVEGKSLNVSAMPDRFNPYLRDAVVADINGERAKIKDLKINIQTGLIEQVELEGHGEKIVVSAEHIDFSNPILPPLRREIYKCKIPIGKL